MMSQKLKWRTAHIIATVVGAALLAMTLRHILVIDSPDLRTGILATSSMEAIMVGLILLARFLSGRSACCWRSPTKGSSWPWHA